MKKRWIALLMAMVMLLGTTAGADQQTQDELTAITLKMKQLLNISDDYDRFDGGYYSENGRTMWNLYWGSDGKSLSVNCDSDGKVYSYDPYDESWSGQWSGDYEPRLPAHSPEEMLEAADGFLDTVLSEEEDYVISDRSMGADNAQIYYRGSILRNGIPTQTGFSLTLHTDNLEIMSYMRYDAHILPCDTGAEDIQISESQAEQAYRETYDIQLRYVSDREGGISLIYTAVPEQMYAVDAVTGEVISWGNGQMYAADTAAAAKGVAEESALTEAESEGIARLEGVQSEAALDAAVREMTELGISEDYVLTGSQFQMIDDDPTANLQYDNGYITRHVCVNAREMTLISAMTFHTYIGTIAYEADQSEETREKAADFVAKYFPELTGHYQLSRVYAPELPTETITYVYFTRVENGVLYEGNQIEIGVNTEINTIDSVNVRWTEGLEFPSVQGIAGAEEAEEAFYGANRPETVYLETYDEDNEYWTERLCYRLGGEAGIVAVDAFTLEERQSAGGNSDVVYSDGEEAGENALLLAGFGIGYRDGSFRGEEEATLRDVLMLVLSAGGIITDRTEDETLLQTAFNYGLLERGEYDPDSPVTRAQMARMLVEMSGYGKAAGLTDIYLLGFADGDRIAGEDQGYIAIARGMGIAAADGSGCFHPLRNITRGEALDMLYAFMTRKI